jgi:hypothetical protein
VIVFGCFPSAVPVTLTTLNLAPAVWVGVVFLAAVIYECMGGDIILLLWCLLRAREREGLGCRVSTEVFSAHSWERSSHQIFQLYYDMISYDLICTIPRFQWYELWVSIKSAEQAIDCNV